MPGNQRPGGDGLDRWLGREVNPLPPPEGTFELIKRRARRRKARKLAVTVSAAAAVAVAAVLVPRVVDLQINSRSSGGLAAGSNSITPTANASGQSYGTGTPAASPATSATSSPSGGITSEHAPVPAGFRPASVTFVGVHTGFVIGQAGTPGHCATQYCTSVARTDDGGQTWYGLPAPVTGPASGAAGVSQVRFLNTLHGWAFGPELWATHDGGQTWTRIATNGQRVVALETAGGTAFAIFATCTGSGADFAANCSAFTLESATADSDSWAAVGGTPAAMTGNVLGAELVLTSERGFLLGPDGTVYSGSLSGAWKSVGNAPCAPEAQLLGAENSTTLVLACPSNHTIYTSADGGKAWTRYLSYPADVTATDIAVSPDGGIVLATTGGIERVGLADGQVTAAVTGTGFSYIGMTTSMRGVALASGASSNDIWITHDGGVTWQPEPVR
jgi:photosystem II stability/assembly factor-like uncharacterized protein